MQPNALFVGLIGMERMRCIWIYHRNVQGGLIMNEADRTAIENLINVVDFLLKQVEQENIGYQYSLTKDGSFIETNIATEGLYEARDSLESVKEWYRNAGH